jgi:hypothetical protein
MTTAVWGTAHGVVFSGPYMRDLGAQIAASWGITVLAAALTVAAMRIGDRAAVLKSWLWRHRLAVWMTAAVVLLVAVAFAMWVRPHLRPFAMLEKFPHLRSFDEETLVRMAWYFSTAGVLAAFGGVLLLLYRWLVQQRLEWAPFLALFLTFSCVYFWRQMIFPDHPWAMRRYIPVVVPGICVAITAAVSSLWSSATRLRLLGRAGAVAIVSLVLAHEIAMARPFWTLREKAGALAALTRLNSLVPDTAIVLYRHDGSDVMVATPLAMQFGRGVLPVVLRTGSGHDAAERRRFEAQVERWLQDDRPVVYVTSDDALAAPTTTSVRWEPLGLAPLSFRTFGTSVTSPPRAPSTTVRQYHVLRAVPETDAARACAPAVLRADTVLLGRAHGLYDLESDHKLPFRWALPHVTVLFPTCDRSQGRPRILRVRARCGRPHAAQGDCAVDVAVNRSRAGTITLGEDWRTVDLTTPDPAIADPRGAIEVNLSGRRFVPAENGMGEDTRELSFQLASVAILPDVLSPVPGIEQPWDANLIASETQRRAGVDQFGFYDEERSEGRMFRWTGGRARITVPPAARLPHTLRVEMSRTLRPTSVVTMRANGCMLFEGAIPHPGWSASFPLAGCLAAGETLEIAIESASARVSNDRRELGVAVRSVRIE